MNIADEPDRAPSAGTRLQSVERASQILLWVADQPHGATAKEIAAAQGLALPTTYHLVNTLVDQGMLTKDVHRRYVLGRSIAILAQAHLRGRSIPEAFLGALRTVSRLTGETSYLADWGEHDIRVLASIEGSRMVRVAEVTSGPYEHGHARANGKVLLAWAPPEISRAYLRSHPLVPLTPNTLCEPAPFEQELERVRERGYAYDLEEYAAGLCCVAAPLRQSGHVVAALGLAVPASRFEEQKAALTATLVEVASGVRESAAPAE